jgi:hypothetical protein
MMCPADNHQMLIVLLLGSKDPHFTFHAAKIHIIEQLAMGRESEKFLTSLLGEGAPFADQLQSLLLSKDICSETREILAKLCPRSLVRWGLENLHDPYVELCLCAAVAAWGAEGIPVLWGVLMHHLEKEDWTFSEELLRRFPSQCPEEKIPYDIQRALKKWRSVNGSVEEL